MNPQDSDASAQAELKNLFMAQLRQRFKAELNRLTAGDMQQSLAPRPDAGQLSFILSYVHMYHWLRQHVPADLVDELLSRFRKRHAFLMDLLVDSPSDADFIRGYIQHWQSAPENSPAQRGQLLQLLAQHQHDPEQFCQYLLSCWRPLDPFPKSQKIAYATLAKDERQRYRDLLDDADQQRLKLIDTLPDKTATQQFAKLGLIPAMGCPQTCRHCMFIFRPLVKDYPEPEPLYQAVNQLSNSVLFTGGDLTLHMDSFYRAIQTQDKVQHFAVLLNGDFAKDKHSTRAVLDKMAQALRRRPLHWVKAKILLQISFDDFHQEVMRDKHGVYKERIPVANMANLVEAAPHYDAIQLCLLHKQTHLNFSMDVFHKGVFKRLLETLGKRGQQVQILSSAPSVRQKSNPHNKERGQVLKDASFVLTRYPNKPILLTSSVIDNYGRASQLDPSEAVKETDYLAQVLTHGAKAGEGLDTDLMFWFNGWATLFSAVHVSLGDFYQDGLDKILSRHAKDPLSRALRDFDRRLLDYYAELRDDLEQKIRHASSPHQLFHALTEDADMRLHMTQQLVKNP